MDVLSTDEREFIQSLDQATIRKALSFRKDNLTKAKATIVAVRSEDLLFFLECIRNGYIPTAPLNTDTDHAHLGIMAKHGEDKGENYYFLAPNPDSLALQTAVNNQEPWIQPLRLSGNFQNNILDNHRAYGAIAKKQAIRRKLLALNIGPQEIITAVLEQEPDNEHIDHLEQGRVLTTFWEDFYNRATDPDPYEMGYSLKPLLAKLFLSKGQKPEDVTTFFDQLENRGGILIAFNDRILTQHHLSVDTEDTSGVDLCVQIPDPGHLGLDVILGFEALGAFEDDLLDLLEASLDENED
jgi:hypothetical protein